MRIIGCRTWRGLPTSNGDVCAGFAPLINAEDDDIATLPQNSGLKPPDCSKDITPL
jgi:hypothetical protein